VNQTTSSTREILGPHPFLPRVPVESVGLPTDNRHPCALKHSLASHLVAGNCNLAPVKQQLGHSSISSTMLYIGTSDQQASEVASAVRMAMC
jgi:site-specific recombinase XerD